MKVFEFIEKIAIFHRFVMRENTGNAEEFAQKLDISRSTLYNIIEELKCYNIDIKYCRTRCTYYYQYPDKVRINISIEQLNDDN